MSSEIFRLMLFFFGPSDVEHHQLNLKLAAADNDLPKTINLEPLDSFVHQKQTGMRLSPIKSALPSEHKQGKCVSKTVTFMFVGFQAPS